MTIGGRQEAEDVRGQWEQTFSGSSRGISVTDPVSGIMQSVDPAFAAMHGGTVEDFVGRPAEDLLTGEFQRQVPQLLAQTDGKAHLQTEVDHVRLDSSVFPVAAEAITTRGEDGQPTAVRPRRRTASSTRRSRPPSPALRRAWPYQPGRSVPARQRGPVHAARAR